MSEIIEALNQLEKEKNISKDILLDAIERSLKAACKKDFDTDENIDVVMDRETGEFHVYAKKEVVEEVERPATQISLEKAKMMNSKYDLGDIINIEITTKDFGRIAAQRARNVIVQAINESERDAISYHNQYTVHPAHTASAAGPAHKSSAHIGQVWIYRYPVVPLTDRFPPRYLRNFSVLLPWILPSFLLYLLLFALEE